MNLRFENQLILILIGYLFLATAYSVINPIHEGTDELRHYRFVRTLVQNRKLPVQGEEPCRSQSHHPPLFYAAGALLTGWIDTGRDVCTSPISNPFWGYRYWEVGTDNKNMYIHPPAERFPWRGEPLAAHLVRLLNVVIGGVAVAVTYLTGRLIWPKKPLFAAGGAAFIAFNPMFLYMAGTINNDVIAALGGAWVAYAGVALLVQKERLNRPIPTGIWLGIVYSFALMAKFSLAPMAAPLTAAVVWVAWRRKQIREGVTTLALMGVTTLLLTGWWFARNWWLYGDPTGFNPVTELWGVRTPSESWGLVWLELPNVWSSLWGRFGFGQIPLPEPIYSFLWGMTLFSAAGALVWLLYHLLFGHRYSRSTTDESAAGLPLLLLLGLVIIAVAVVISYMLLSPAGAMGRFLFPGLPAFALLLFWGLSRWLVLARFGDDSWLRGLTLIANGGMALLAAVALWGYLAPAYAAPPSWTDSAIPKEAISPEAPVIFEPFVQLHAFEISDGRVAPGEALEIDLYWEVLADPPGDYTFFAHLIDEAGTMVTQRDTHPATGKRPASLWRSGDRFVDHITLHLPETAYPDTARLQVGFYAPQEGYRLGITAGGLGQGDAFTLGLVDIDAGASYVPLSRNFEDEALLLGYRYDERELTPGETAAVTLFWAAEPTAAWGNLEAQLYLGSTTGAPLAASLLAEIAQPTTLDGQTAWETTFLVTIPAEHSGGQDHFTIILFDIFTQKRLNMIAKRGNWIDNELLLAGVRIEPTSNSR